MKKSFIKRILESSDKKKEVVDGLKKRYKYLKSKNFKEQESNQMKYIKFQFRNLVIKRV